MRISDWSSDVCSSDLDHFRAIWHGLLGMEQMAHRAAAHEIDKSKYVGIIWRPAEYGGDGRAQRTAVRRNYGQEFIALGHVGDNSQEESHSASVEQNVAHGVQCVARSTRRGLLRLTVGCFENRKDIGRAHV